MSNLTFDYPRLWKTLMRTGIKERFSQIRREFFMKIAADGARVYTTDEEMETILDESYVISNISYFRECTKYAIPSGSKFKHYEYATPDDELMIEYFANLSTRIPKEFIDFVNDGKDGLDYNLDGHCTSLTATVNNEDDTSDDGDELPKKEITVHLIIIGEGDNLIDPDLYSMVIKHEITHACLYEVIKLIKSGYYKSIRIPGTWTDEDINNWTSDIEYLLTVLEGTDEESCNFREFVCDFLMYESDGPMKVKNPIKETTSTKSQRTDAKPKITYRTVTPFDRYQETIDMLEDGYGELFSPILESIRSCYEDYDKFLEDIRM